MNKKIKLHLGAGKRDFGKGWISIDAANFPHISSYNITKLPYKNNTVDIIYSSHTIEYFDREEVLKVLEEWYRVLKIGGTIRLAVPNFDILTRLYQNKKIKIEQTLGPLYGKMAINSQLIYHKTIYDFDSLKELLEKIGFKDIIYWDWRKTEHSMHDDFSQAYIPHMDKENGTLISLNVEAIK